MQFWFNIRKSINVKYYFKEWEYVIVSSNLRNTFNKSGKEGSTVYFIKDSYA